MSGGAKKKSGRGQGWEEACDEFYQESYPSTEGEFEVFQKDPKHLATLLPSKQTRQAAATIRIRNTDTRTSRRATASRSRRDTLVTRRPSMAPDVEEVVMPDLAEPLSNEQSIWEEIMLIKAMPVSMAQKKDMKAKLQRGVHLRLLGFEQFKWKRRKTFRQFQVRLKEMCTKLELWRNDLKKIEGNFGTGVVAFFLFVRWLLFLNLVIFSFIFLFVILPTILFETKTTTECSSSDNSTECCAATYFNQDSSDDTQFVMDLVQGTGSVERTVIFYGIYSNETYQYPVADTLLSYNIPLAYCLTTLAFFLISLLAIVKSAAKGFRERLVEGEGQFYQYCNLIFGGWDFCTHNEKSAAIKHKALFNEIKACLEMEKLEEERQNRTSKEKTKLFFIRFFVNVLVLTVLAASGTGIYFVFDFSNQQVRNYILMEYTTQLNGSDNILKLLYEFLPAICIVGLNLFVPFVFRYLISFERYTPLVVIRLTLVRTIFLRLSSLVVLLATIYFKIMCDPDTDKLCTKNDCKFCWESHVGQQFYKLVLIDFLMHIFITFFVNFPRAVIAKHVESRFARFIGEQEFDLPKHVLDIIYSQTLCWLGAFYSPILPVICSVICFLLFYIKKFACLVNSQPSSTVYRASRSNSMFMVVLLVSFVFSILPVAYSIAEITPSRSCGPFRGLYNVWSVFVEAFLLTPYWIQNVVFFIGTAGFGIPLFIILVLLLYYYTAVNSANRHMVVVLKNQLVLEGHDKQFLLDRLSSFIKQQQEVQKRQRHAEIMREGERERNPVANSTN